MSDTDVLKMKVADLKRELKIRGLPVTGIKTELQERLQSALLDGDLTLEDTAISEHEDLLEEDVLTDEEAESAVLESPLIDDDKSILSPQSNAGDLDLKIDEVPKPKKVILKRKNSVTTPLVATVTPTIIENNSTKTSISAPISDKIRKIEFNNSGNVTETNGKNGGDDNKLPKVAQLTLKERMEMRAKKFGVNHSIETTTPGLAIALKDTKLDQTTASSKDPKVIEALKKRAIRFGCAVSPHIVEIEKAEKLQKRKERFGGGTDSTLNITVEENSAYAEKARLRLERFQTATK